MKYRKLGTSDLEVSVVGLGCWQVGGYYWGEVDEGEWIAGVRRALDLGINFFDTADFYGFGRSEELLAQALGDRRDEVIIATKVGLVVRDGRCDFAANDLLGLEEHIEKDLSRQHIIEAAEDSLRRLGRDVIDLYYLHWPDPATPLAETMGAMEELVRAGKVQAVGCSNFSVAQMREANSYVPVQSHQLPYSLLDRGAEQELLPACQADRVGVIAYWALCRGLLTGKYGEDSSFGADDWRHYDPLFQGEQLHRNLQIVAELKPIAEDEGLTMAQLAIAWVFHQPGITATIVGARRPDQVEQNARAGEVTLSPDSLARIKTTLKEAEE